MKAKSKLAPLLLLFLPALLFPRWWCGLDADAYYRGDAEAQLRLARGVAAWVSQPVTAGEFRTGSARFDGEWAFGTYQMAALGFGQLMLEHPETRGEFLPALETCLDRMQASEISDFDTRAWGEPALEDLEKGHGHAAYLGYFNLALGLHRMLVRDSRYSALHDRITVALERRLRDSPILLIPTYPGESYPVDNCAVIGSIALHGKAAGADHSGILRDWSAACRERFLDPRSGLLIQAVDGETGAPADAPRASGTALGLYMLSVGGMDLAETMFHSLRRNGSSFLGFGLVREYPPGLEGGGDIDSGPVVLGISFSGTGFALGGNRSFGDPDGFRALYRTAHLVGAPLDADGRRRYVCGGPIGNAILFAMLTAGPR